MTDDLLKLLTAAVDGELTPDQQWYVHRLLTESVEARSMFARLQADSIRVRNLQSLPPVNLFARVMAALPHAEPATPPKQKRRAKSWVPVGIAASLFLTVSATAFWFVTRPDTSKARGQQIANGQPGNYSDVLPRENGPLLSSPPAAPLPPANNIAQYGPPVPPETPNRIDELPPPRPVFEGTAFPPLPPIPPLEKIVVRVPLLAMVAEFERDDVRKQLTDELAREPVFRIDVFVKDASRGADLFQTAAKASGINVFADAGALDRMKKKMGSAYLIYTESLTPADVRDLFTKLSADDAKNMQRVFDLMHVAPAQASDQKDLKDTLGVDPGLWKRPQPGAANTTEPKPISSSTGDQIAKSLTSPKPGEKNAALMSFTPAALRSNPALSKELKEFLAKRGERKASAVPVLIVIRQSN